MPTKPLLARIAFATFLAIGGGILLNILYLQDGSVATAADRGKLDKAQQRALLERNRRLALDQSEARDPGTIRPPEKVASAALMRPTLPIDAGAGPRATRVPASAALPVAKAGNATIVDAEPERSPDTVRLVHQRLATLGYEPGTASSVPGLVMRGAVMAYEYDHGLPLTGEPSEYLLRYIDNAPGARDATARPPRAFRTQQAEQVLRTVQQSLAALGYFQAKVDGRMGEDTVRAIREYEMDAGLVPTGRVSGPLLVRLARSASATRPQQPAKAAIR